jgi:hypothetical protein
VAGGGGGRGEFCGGFGAGSGGGGLATLVSEEALGIVCWRRPQLAQMRVHHASVFNVKPGSLNAIVCFLVIVISC